MSDLTVDQFRELIRDSRVKCRVPQCSYKGHSLTAHVRDAHKLSVGQYVKKYQKAGEQALNLISSPIVRELMFRLDRRPTNDPTLSNIADKFDPSKKIDEIFDFWRGRFPPHVTQFSDAMDEPQINPRYRFPKEATSALLYAMATGRNAVIIGPTGCGKTELVRQVHARLGRRLGRINMHGDATRASFVGAMRASPAGTHFKYGIAPNAMRAGATLLVDEYDYTPAHIAAVCNPILESNRAFYLEETDEVIKAAPGFAVVATGNTGGKGDSFGQYAGTEILNSAYLDRFAIRIDLDYLPKGEEIDMLRESFPSIDTTEISNMVAAATEIRVAFKQGQLSVPLSTRKIVDYFDIRQALGHEAALQLTLTSWLDSDDETFVKQILQRTAVIKGKI